MTYQSAQQGHVLFQRIGGILPRAGKEDSSTHRPAIRRCSRRAGSCEAGFWRATSRQEVQKIIRAAQRYELTGRQRGQRNGPLGFVALEVLVLFGNLVSFRSGRLDPSLDWITRTLRRSRDAIVKALKALHTHGFLDWLRRFEPTLNEGQGPQVRQVSNAYRLSAPKRALALLGRWAGKPVLPDDEGAERAEAKAMEAAHVTSLDLGSLATFLCGDTPLGRAMAQMGRALDLRESGQRTESQSTSFS